MKLRKQLLLFVGLGLLVFSPLAAHGQFFFENPLVGKQAPDFTLKTTAGQEMSLSEYRGNDAALMFFWATWCPSCREELKLLTKEEELFKKSGLKVILVNLEENPALVKSYANKLKLPYNIFLDETSGVGQEYGIIGLPTVFFINEEGVIVRMEPGLPENFLKLLKTQVKNMDSAKK